MIPEPLELLNAMFEAWMESAGLIVEYIKVVIWPAAIVSLILIYRRPLVDLIDRVREAEVLGVSLKTEARDLAVESAVAALTQRVDALAAPRPAGERDESQSDAATAEGESPIAPQEPEVERLRARIEALESRGAESGRNVESEGLLRELGDTASRLSQDTQNRIAKSRARMAWMALDISVKRVAKLIGLPAEAATVEGVTGALFNRGLTNLGTHRVGSRIERLWEAINASPDAPDEQTLSAFTTAVANLQTVLDTLEVKA